MFCVLAFGGCATVGLSEHSTAEEPPPIVSSQAFSGIIIPRLVNFPESWTPTDDQVILAEPKIQRCALSRHPNLRSTLRRFFRQYSGWTVDGRKKLDVSFFDTWRYHVRDLRHPLIVLDGNDDGTYFQITLDLESQQCSF
jgi:hypothetical protein